MEPTVNDYPTKAELATIEKWHHSDWLNLIDFIEGIYPHYGHIKRSGKKVVRVAFVTGGWSGCEDIIAALRRNTMFQMVCWESSHRGGKHVYRVRNITK